MLRHIGLFLDFCKRLRANFRSKRAMLASPRDQSWRLIALQDRSKKFTEKLQDTKAAKMCEKNLDSAYAL